MGAHKQRKPVRLGRASAYYRLAAKADKAGNHLKGQRYREIADGLVNEEHAGTPVTETVEAQDEFSNLFADLGMPEP